MHVSSSIGISFQLKGDVKGVKAKINFARYF